MTRPTLCQVFDPGGAPARARQRRRQKGPREGAAITRARRALVAEDPDPGVRRLAQVVLAFEGDEAALDYLMGVARTGERTERIKALHHFARVAPGGSGLHADLDALIRARESLSLPCPCCPDPLITAAGVALVAERSQAAIGVLLGAYWRVAEAATADALGRAIVRGVKTLEPVCPDGRSSPAGES